MKFQQVTSLSSIDAAAIPVAMFYAKPTLRIYGSVVELTKGSNGSNTDGHNGNQAVGSDPSIKESVVRIGEHPSGFGVYLFDYKTEYRDLLGSSRQFGVMADEVEAVFPEAVSRSEYGFKQVDYAKIGVIRSVH